VSTILGDSTISTEALQQMRERATPSDKWWAYQNQALDSAGLGHLQFLQVGPDRTFKEAPERMPDSQHSIGWRYLRVGVVDLETGKIVAA
jgi:hypothetical protein